jgi:hypothetical protein
MSATHPLISVCLPTARPYAWRRAYDIWRDLTKHLDRVEFILFFAEMYGFDRENPPGIAGNPVIVWSEGPSTSITGWNAAAAASSGRLLLMAHDDMCPPKGWDVDLLKVLPSLREEYALVLETAEQDYDLAVLTQVRYERLGYVFYPQYRSEGALQEFYMHAEMDGVNETAPLLRFTHYHPKYGDGLWDQVYAERHGEKAVQGDHGLFQARERLGFPKEIFFREEFNIRNGETLPPTEEFMRHADHDR